MAARTWSRVASSPSWARMAASSSSRSAYPAMGRVHCWTKAAMASSSSMAASQDRTRIRSSATPKVKGTPSPSGVRSKMSSTLLR